MPLSGESAGWGRFSWFGTVGRCAYYLHVSIEQVATEMRAGIAKVAAGLADLNRSALMIHEARVLLRQSTQGTCRSEAAQAAGLLASVQERIIALYELGNSATTTIQNYLAGVAGGATTGAGPASPRQPSTSAAPARTVDLPSDRIDALRRTLPPDVPPRGQRVRGAPQPKTHGRWVDSSGREHEEVSGWDDKYRSAKAWFESRGKKVPTTVSDVEIKLAVHMQENCIKNATLIINNTPCVGMAGCDTLLPEILPDGYTMDVYGSGGFHKVYRGRAK